LCGVLDVNKSSYYCSARSLMREAGLVTVVPKKRHSYPAGEVDKPNQKWVGDITYLWISAGWVYLAVVLDLFSRKVVVGRGMSASPDTVLILAALNQAAVLRQVTPGIGLCSIPTRVANTPATPTKTGWRSLACKPAFMPYGYGPAWQLLGGSAPWV
jgi:transposase InsO family protein